MRFEPFPFLEDAVVVAADHTHAAVIRHNGDIAVHRGKGARIVIHAPCGHVYLIGLGGNAVDKRLRWELIGIGCGIFRAAAAAAHANVLWLDHRQKCLRGGGF